MVLECEYRLVRISSITSQNDLRQMKAVQARDITLTLLSLQLLFILSLFSLIVSKRFIRVSFNLETFTHHNNNTLDNNNTRTQFTVTYCDRDVFHSCLEKGCATKTYKSTRKCRNVLRVMLPTVRLRSKHSRNRIKESTLTCGYIHDFSLLKHGVSLIQVLP